MDIENITAGIQDCNASTGAIFTRLATAFPALLAVVAESDESSSLSSLSGLLLRIKDGFSLDVQDESAFFREYDRRTGQLFEDLSARMSSLEGIHERVAAIRADSEELELISLNAMVISIKSGEKGRAFSVITENLKRLSAQLISISNNLIREEQTLFARNDALRKSFTSVMSAKGLASGEHDSAVSALIVPVLSRAETDLAEMERTARLVNAPIRAAMAGIQMQDIVRQSNDQILLALTEMSNVRDDATREDSLDRLSFDCEILEICSKIAADVESNLASSIETFSTNWEEVHRVLDDVEGRRVGFLARYLDRRASADASLPLLLDRISSSFSDYIAHIALYQHGQKTMVKDSAAIVGEIKSLKNLFETISPVIARLQHVRITQQIEVAKNTAIAAVRDTVSHMSDLILRSDARVQDTRKELETFIAGIGELNASFNEDSARDSRELERIKREKQEFFQGMQVYQEELASTVARLRVYPDSFGELCGEVDALLVDLKSARETVRSASSQFSRMIREYRGEAERLLAEMGLSAWEIRSDRLRGLVERFTITAHKEAAGEIGGFEVEGTGAEAVGSGDVTLFF